MTVGPCKHPRRSTSGRPPPSTGGTTAFSAGAPMPADDEDGHPVTEADEAAARIARTMRETTTFDGTHRVRYIDLIELAALRSWEVSVAAFLSSILDMCDQSNGYGYDPVNVWEDDARALLAQRAARPVTEAAAPEGELAPAVVAEDLRALA